MTDSSTETSVRESGNVEQPVETQVGSTQTTDRTPASSPETKPAEKETMVDRVRSALKTERLEAAPASRTPGKSATEADPTKPIAHDDGSKEFTAEEVATLAPRTRQRMQKLTSDLKAQGTELQKLQPKAAEYDKIESFITRNGLQPRDVQSVAEIASMLVHNPQAAHDRLMPIMVELQRILGVQLSPELRQQVEQGYITEEHARQLSQATARERLATRRAAQLAESQQQNETVTRQRQVVDTSLSAMDTWEKQTAAKDPDWHLKREEVTELVETAILKKSQESGRPWFPNPQEVNEFLAKAYETVNTRFKRFAPRPTEIKPAVTTGASPRSVPAPKNTMDIIKASLNR